MFAILSFLPLLVPVQDRALDDLQAALGTYLEARALGKDLDQARDGLEAALAGTFEAGEALRRTQDLGRALWLARVNAAPKVRGGKVISETYREGAFASEGLEYVYRVPRDYDPSSRSYPLILAIGDQDETPAEHLRDSWSSRPVREGAIVVALGMPTEVEEWDQVMFGGKPGGLSHVLSGLRIALGRFAVDPNRVFVAGRGKGVVAAMTAGDTAPHRFAGVIGRAGDAAEMQPDNFGNLPVYLAGGGARATAFAEAAQKLGLENCTLDPAGTELDLWTWMGEHPRDAVPGRVSLVVGTPFPIHSSWLRVSPSGKAPRATVRLDRGAGTVRIEATEITRVTVYLNDRLLDLDRPVKVIANGVEGEVQLTRSLPITLDRIVDGTSDPGIIYTTELVVDLGGGPLWPEVLASTADPEFAAELARAEGSVEALWLLYERTRARGDALQGRGALRRIVRLDPEHRQARAALGHRWSSVMWFTSQSALDRFSAEQEPGLAAARGWVEAQSIWMHPDDRALLGKGREKDHETGEWLSTAERKLLAKGWGRQDLEWIEPDQVDFMDRGLWRVDGEWVSLERADRRRSSIESMWHIPDARVRLHTSVDRAVALLARSHMDRAIEDMRKVFGAQPQLPLDVTLLRDEEQFDRFALGEPDGRRPPAHVGRQHLINNAFFAESWFPAEGGKPSYDGQGVGLWNAQAPNGNAYGVHSARLALGLSYVDALDPSSKATRRGPGPEFYDAFEAEKKLPPWLRLGGAVYAERYFIDDTVPPGGDPAWARVWSLQNLSDLGGLRPLAQVLELRIDPDQRDEARRLMLESGAMVSFLVDGECAPVAEAHAEFKRALVAGRLRRKHVKALVGVLLAHEAELRAFLGVQ
jgi:hypothetical protein